MTMVYSKDTWTVNTWHFCVHCFFRRRRNKGSSYGVLLKAGPRPSGPRPAAHGPPRPGGPATRRPSGPRPTARDGPAARRSGGPEAHTVLLSSGKSTRMLRFASGLGAQMNDGEFDGPPDRRGPWAAGRWAFGPPGRWAMAGRGPRAAGPRACF